MPTKRKFVVFNVALAPYRIDFFNTLASIGQASFYFSSKQVEGSQFSLPKMMEKCNFVPHFLNGVKLCGRKFPLGIIRILKEEMPDCVLVPEFSLITLLVCMYRMLFAKHMRVICICDDSIDMIKGNEFSAIHAWARRVLVPLCDDLVLLDKDACEWYQQRYHKGIWFPLIRDEVLFRKELEGAACVSAAFSKRFDLEGKRIILYVGRLIKLKNVESIIHAMQAAPSDCVLVVVGDGEERGALMRQACMQQVNCIFPGWQSGDELLAWFRLARVFVLASFREAFGAVVNEALLSGCRVCVSNRAGSSCLVTEENGALFNPASIDELKSALKHELAKCTASKQNGSLMPMTYASCVRKLEAIL